MNACFRCGWRYRPCRTSRPEAQLALALPEPLPRRRSAPSRRPVPKTELLRLHASYGPDGQERYALLIEGQRVPIVCPSLVAALATKTTMEAGRGGAPPLRTTRQAALRLHLRDSGYQPLPVHMSSMRRELRDGRRA
jgi:hypothetical protein